MFTVEQRDAVRDRVLALGQADPRVLSGAVVGSLAQGGGDEHSDIDLTFTVADDVSPPEVLGDWTRTLGDELDAVHVVDVAVGPTLYRVLLLPEALQLDLSVTPAERAAETPARLRATPAAGEVFGWGVVYGLHARACIARGRVWQAEHYVGAVRDRALTLACLRHGLVAAQARGYDDLPADALERFAPTHVGSLEPEALRRALNAAMRALLAEGEAAGVPGVADVAQRAGTF